MIVDAFMFNDEFEMLDIRLKIMNNKVDRFIILEGNKTWSGIDKEYHLSNNLDRYVEYKDKIKVIKLKIPKDYKDWKCENYSRESLQIEIDKLNDNDIIIHSDLDEILNPEKIDSLLELLETENKPVNCRCSMYAYSFDRKLRRDWYGPVIAKKYMFENPQKLYKGNNHKRKDRSHCCRVHENVGWHWTWIGNDERIKNKVVSCIESQYKNPDEVLQAFKDSDTQTAINHKCDSYVIKELEYPEFVLNIITNYPYWSKNEQN